MPRLQKRAFSKSQLQLKKANFIPLKKPLNWGGGPHVNFTMDLEIIQQNLYKKLKKELLVKKEETLNPHRKSFRSLPLL